MDASKALKQFKEALRSNKGADYQASQITHAAPYLEYTTNIVETMDEALPEADPLVQVAIMDAYYEISNEKFHEQDLHDLMTRATQMGDEGEALYMAARLALGRLTGLVMDNLDGWGDGELDITATSVKRRRGPGRLEVIDEITVIIHGTWASDGKWWRPRGNFFEYVKKDLGRSDVYGKSDQFKWSGKNRDSKRREAGKSLHKWLRSHPAREVNVFAHSHGANVAMLATHQDIKIDRLVMLSPPVRDDYFAKWSNVKEAFNIQASFDPVVGIARGGQWFNPKGSSGRRIPVKEKKMSTSGHSSSHEPDVWKKEKLSKFVGIPW